MAKNSTRGKATRPDLKPLEPPGRRLDMRKGKTGSDGLDDFVRFKTSGADLDRDDSAVDHRLDGLDVRAPRATDPVL